MASDSYFGITLNELNRSVNLFGFEEKTSDRDIDTTNVWSETTAGDGSASIYTSTIKIDTGSVSGGIAALESLRPFPISTKTTGTGLMFSKFSMEWACGIVNYANIDENTFLMGLVRNSGNKADDNNMAGFVIVGGKLRARVDKDGTTVESDDLMTPTSQTTQFRIECANNIWKFYINNEMKAELTAPSGSTHSVNYIVFYIANNAAATGTIYPQGIRAWFE